MEPERRRMSDIDIIESLHGIDKKVERVIYQLDSHLKHHDTKSDKFWKFLIPVVLAIVFAIASFVSLKITQNLEKIEAISKTTQVQVAAMNKEIENGDIRAR